MNTNYSYKQIKNTDDLNELTKTSNATQLKSSSASSPKELLMKMINATIAAIQNIFKTFRAGRISLAGNFSKKQLTTGGAVKQTSPEVTQKNLNTMHGYGLKSTPEGKLNEMLNDCKSEKNNCGKQLLDTKKMGLISESVKTVDDFEKCVPILDEMEKSISEMGDKATRSLEKQQLGANDTIDSQILGDSIIKDIALVRGTRNKLANKMKETLDVEITKKNTEIKQFIRNTNLKLSAPGLLLLGDSGEIKVLNEINNKINEMKNFEEKIISAQMKIIENTQGTKTDETIKNELDSAKFVDKEGYGASFKLKKMAQDLKDKINEKSLLKSNQPSQTQSIQTQSTTPSQKTPEVELRKSTMDLDNKEILEKLENDSQEPENIVNNGTAQVDSNDESINPLPTPLVNTSKANRPQSPPPPRPETTPKNPNATLSSPPSYAPPPRPDAIYKELGLEKELADLEVELARVNAALLPPIGNEATGPTATVKETTFKDRFVEDITLKEFQKTYSELMTEPKEAPQATLDSVMEDLLASEKELAPAPEPTASKTPPPQLTKPTLFAGNTSKDKRLRTQFYMEITRDIVGPICKNVSSVLKTLEDPKICEKTRLTGDDIKHLHDMLSFYENQKEDLQAITNIQIKTGNMLRVTDEDLQNAANAIKKLTDSLATPMARAIHANCAEVCDRYYRSNVDFEGKNEFNNKLSAVFSTPLKIPLSIESAIKYTAPNSEERKVLDSAKASSRETFLKINELKGEIQEQFEESSKIPRFFENIKNNSPITYKSKAPEFVKTRVTNPNEPPALPYKPYKKTAEGKEHYAKMAEISSETQKGNFDLARTMADNELKKIYETYKTAIKEDMFIISERAKPEGLFPGGKKPVQNEQELFDNYTDPEKIKAQEEWENRLSPEEKGKLMEEWDAKKADFFKQTEKEVKSYKNFLDGLYNSSLEDLKKIKEKIGDEPELFLVGNIDPNLASEITNTKENIVKTVDLLILLKNASR